MISSLTKLAVKALKTNFTSKIDPYKLTFAITYRCNSRCRHCNIWKLRPKNELKLDEIEEFVKKNNFFRWVNLTGGEPFLRKDLVDIIQTFVQYSPNLSLINMITNSFHPGFIEGKVKEMLKFDSLLIIVGVSIEGLKETDEYIRRVKGHFDKAMDLYKRLKNLEKKRKNFKTYIGYTISPFNAGKLKETILGLREMGIDPSEIHLNLFWISHYYNLKTFKGFNASEYYKRALEDIKFYLKVRSVKLSPDKILDAIFIRLMKSYIRTKKTPLRCKALQSSIFLDSFGNVFPCSIWNLKLGNIRESNYDLQPIINSEKARKILKLIRSFRCPNCWTACEAYQTILGNLVFGSKELFFNLHI